MDRRYAVEAGTGPGPAPYSLERTRGWLALLATGLARRQQTIFVLERIGADLLPSARARRLVEVAPKAVFGLSAA